MRASDLVPGAAWAKLALYAVGGLVALGILWAVAYRLLYQGQDLARARGNGIVQEEQLGAEGAIADNAMEAVHEREVYREHVREIVREGQANVDRVWTGETVGHDVDAAGAAALCSLHDSLCRPASPEAVQPVREPVPGGDATRPTAGE